MVDAICTTLVEEMEVDFVILKFCIYRYNKCPLPP